EQQLSTAALFAADQVAECIGRDVIDIFARDGGDRLAHRVLAAGRAERAADLVPQIKNLAHSSSPPSSSRNARAAASTASQSDTVTTEDGKWIYRTGAPATHTRTPAWLLWMRPASVTPEILVLVC